ncbi:MAG: hypothetical protein ACI8RD_003767, partial [Bacillariaceae sp.]|jgi:hypothetical protein
VVRSPTSGDCLGDTTFEESLSALISSVDVDVDTTAPTYPSKHKTVDRIVSYQNETKRNEKLIAERKSEIKKQAI